MGYCIAIRSTVNVREFSIQRKIKKKKEKIDENTLNSM